MSPDEKQTLIEKIDELPPEQRKRVEEYVDALFEEPAAKLEGGESSRAEQLSTADASNRRRRREGKSNDEKSRQMEGEAPRFRWRGALSHLADEYTAEELQEKADEWRMKKALDY